MYTYVPLTGHTEAIFVAGFLQSKKPTKEASNGSQRHQGPGSRLRDVADGGVRAPIIANYVGMKVNVAEAHRRLPHQEVPTHFAIKPVSCT